MKVRYFRKFSQFLNQEMEYKIYGQAGKLCLVIPCQDGRFYEWEDQGMFSLLSQEIDHGKIQFVCVDSVDAMSWSAPYAISKRMAIHENWIQYVMQELIPAVLLEEKRNKNESWMVTGCSMGGYHATNLFLRFPERFDQLLSMSGIYNMEDYFIGAEKDYNGYINDPCCYLANMEESHPYIQAYNQNEMNIVVGQGNWEDRCLSDTRQLMDLFFKKGIHAHFEFYDANYPHDWPSWKEYVLRYIPQMIQNQS